MDEIVAMLRMALALVLAGAAAGVGLAPALGQGAAGNPFEDRPGLTFDYYDVSGRTFEEIRASLDGKRRADPETGIGYDGYTAWYLDWRIPGRAEGPCRLDRAEVTIDVIVGLPRLVDFDAAPPDVLQRWQLYLTAMKTHEAKHVRIAYAGRKAALRAIRRAECGTASQAAEDAMAELERKQDEYDRRTRHGLAEGAHFP